MGTTILDGAGSGFEAHVTSENRLLVDISGATIIIGSVSASVDSVYVQSGTINIQQEVPTASNLNNAAGSLVYSGTAIGSIVKTIGATEYVKVLTYSGAGDSLIGIGSWSAV